jgi:hypothetical protein
MRTEPSGEPCRPSLGLGGWAAQTFIRWARLGCLGAIAEPGARAWRAARNDLPRWHERAGSSEGCRGSLRRGSQAQRDHREALGRSRGGYGTKACVIADSQGRAIAFRIAPGQAHELPEVIPLLDSLPGVPTWVVADRGYSSSSFREHIWSIVTGRVRPPFERASAEVNSRR